MNYMHVEEGSQLYTDLSQLLQTMKYLYGDKGLLASRRTGRYDGNCPLYDEIDYIIKGLENTIEKGYRIHEPVPEGYQRIDVPIGSLVVTEDQNVQTILRELAKGLRRDTGIGLMDAKSLLIEHEFQYDYCLEYITSGEREKDMRKRGIFVDTFYRNRMRQVDMSNTEELLRAANRQAMESLSETNRVRGLVTPPYCQDFKQKQALIDIIKDDERDNLYDIPRCGECNELLTLVRPGKWQCDHCGF